MRIFVVGGTGFIGGRVVARLVEAGCDVLVLHRGKRTAALPAGAGEVLGDRQDAAALGDAVRRAAPEVVVDVVPYSEADARALLEAAAGVARRVLALSSGDVYRNYDVLRGVTAGPPDPPPLLETAPLRETLYPYRPQSPGPEDWTWHYDKILVERAVLGDRRIAGTVLRLPAVYGAGDPQRRVPQYLEAMDAGRETIELPQGQAAWRWTRGHVDNVAAAIAASALDDRASGHVFNVGEDDALTEADWVRAIGDAAGWRGEVVEVPAERLPQVPRRNWTSHLETDTRRLRDRLGFSDPVPRAEAIRRTVASERAGRR